MYEITYLVFINYRGPFGITVKLPRLRTAHMPRPLKTFQSFTLEEALTPASTGANGGGRRSA